MYVHSATQASLASGILDTIISLDALLSIAGEDDKAELSERLSALDQGKFQTTCTQTTRDMYCC
jgi:hypothetical protein